MSSEKRIKIQQAHSHTQPAALPRTATTEFSLEPHRVASQSPLPQFRAAARSSDSVQSNRNHPARHIQWPEKAANSVSETFTIKSFSVIEINFNYWAEKKKFFSTNASAVFIQIRNINRNVPFSLRSDLEGNNINFIHEQAFAGFTQLEDL